MSSHDYLLLLGSDAADAGQLEIARRHLQASGRITAASAVVHGPSVVDGDERCYFNQALRVSSALPRAGFAVTLKAIESAMGRGTVAGCLIDIDLAAEYGHDDAFVWQAADKLVHPLFVRLSAQLRPLD
ncbi:2-amino-4-hydroxy-6-hydroxymethyldihydropteridine diphosphokinase [Pseudoxanthomonas dokdonensis]|uniref:2-amino-4-hydroxy-6-hydroxymethyldihydropteridine diphosphokinase n=1 Tax=Pseudoxanthomonas dokdonensis TaxID=344882 RepID=A0A0R0CFU4_9GAMM|nr:2-amino-4-hydroxy-6-hydroxymethyldihydropteridine diphosphokinase [Pseudoxanthomonas dokdonensis]KRG68373.1 hypothetical protein ABB29_13735 [Pseudoxanthomonas dokdonensis]